MILSVMCNSPRNGAEPDERLHPDRILFDFPNVSISPSDDCIIGEEHFCIEITSDNGVNITEGELLFKLHNQIIPYLDRLSDHTIEVVLAVGYWEGSSVAVCTLMFQSELEMDEETED